MTSNLIVKADSKVIVDIESKFEGNLVSRKRKKSKVYDNMIMSSKIEKIPQKRNKKNNNMETKKNKINYKRELKEQISNFFLDKDSSRDSSDLDLVKKDDPKTEKQNSETKEYWNLIKDISSYSGNLKFNENTFPIISKKRPQDFLIKHDPYELFCLFFTDELFEHFKVASNKFRINRKNSKNYSVCSYAIRHQYDKEMTVKEIKVYLAIKLFVCINNQSSIVGKIFIFELLKIIGVKKILKVVS